MLEWQDATVVEDAEQGSGSPPEPSLFDDVTEISADLQTLALAQAEDGPVLIVRDELEPAEDDDVAGAFDSEKLLMLDPAEFEGVESLAASMRESPILRKLRLLFASLPHANLIRARIARTRLPQLLALLGSGLRTLWSALKSAAGRALASLPPAAMIKERVARSRLPSLVASAGGAARALRSRLEPASAAAIGAFRSKMPRLFEITTTALGALRSTLPSAKLPPATDDPDALPLLAEKHARQRVASIAMWTGVALGVWALGSRLVSLFDF
jgi:hypothetical protein